MASKWVSISSKLAVNQEDKRIRFDTGLSSDEQAILSTYIAQGFTPTKKVSRKSNSSVKKESYYKAKLTEKQFEAFKKQVEDESYIVAAHAANKLIAESK